MVPVCGGVGGRRLLRMVGAGRGSLLLSVARGRSCQTGGTIPAGRGRAQDVRKRGYDITRDPHLNKVEGALKKKQTQKPLLTGPL
ncbi:hypothetical protein BTVI_142936 [Pitangus sulphuratus]|nr:hypothetical protein BTVI_142936 [Pitangus sulphuratus]